MHAAFSAVNSGFYVTPSFEKKSIDFFSTDLGVAAGFALLSLCRS
jgi:hypothetical protein